LLSPRGGNYAAGGTGGGISIKREPGSGGSGGGSGERPKPPQRMASSAVMEGEELDTFLNELEQFGADFSDRLSM
jgi:hypothetical protein